MTTAPQPIPRILVTTDFSEASETAFYHALAISLARQGRLTLLHTGSESRDQVRWDGFPGVRETLCAWDLLPEDAPRSAVMDNLNLGVAKMVMRDDDPRQGITDYVRRHPTDLLVMATRGRTGLVRMRRSSVAETVTHQTKSYALLLPGGTNGFVDPQTGVAQLSRVVCALEPERDPRQALGFLRQWLPAMGAEYAEVLLLRGPSQEILLPPQDKARWEQRPMETLSAETIIDAARDFEPGLVITSAHGPTGIGERMRGSLIDRLLRELKLPLLSLPPR